MPLAKLAGMAMAAMLIAIGTADLALAQSDDSTDSTGKCESEQSGQDQMMPGMMDGRMHGMMGGMPMGPMRARMMKIMFAVADTDGDGALSFEEVTAIHKRIFAAIDANKDGKVTLEEMQAFMQGP
jgi:hypothetical protein